MGPAAIADCRWRSQAGSRGYAERPPLIAVNRRHVRQVGRQLDARALSAAQHVGDQRVQIAITPVRRRGQSLIAP